MLRVPLSLAVLLSALLALTAAAEAAETWEPADKQAFGTAHDLRSKVWFTLGRTGMDEAYWPRIDRPAVRSLDLKVGGKSESDLATGRSRRPIRAASPRSRSSPRATVRGASRRPTSPIPARDVVLIDVDVRSLNGRPLHLSTDLRAGLDKDRRAETALLARPALRDVDGVREHPRHARPRARAHAAGRAGRARRLAPAGLRRRVSRELREGLARLPDSLPPRPAAAAPYAALYDTSLMVLAASEDKTYRGASVASPSMPWAWGQNTIEKPSGVYHLVWSRDLYQVATAQLAAGDRAAAERSLDFLLFRQQKPDGSFPQNSEVDGTEHWKEIQMDQVGMPIVLAWQLGRTDARTLAKVRLAGRVPRENGPLTGQERWENQRGWSPATIAAEIAGLVTGADLLRRTGDAATAARWEATADAWQRSVQAWTATTNGPLPPARTTCG